MAHNRWAVVEILCLPQIAGRLVSMRMSRESTSPLLLQPCRRMPSQRRRNAAGCGTWTLPWPGCWLSWEGSTTPVDGGGLAGSWIPGRRSR
jgi:hypothetical protein